DEFVFCDSDRAGVFGVVWVVIVCGEAAREGDWHPQGVGGAAGESGDVVVGGGCAGGPGCGCDSVSDRVVGDAELVAGFCVSGGYWGLGFCGGGGVGDGGDAGDGECDGGENGAT